MRHRRLPIFEDMKVAIEESRKLGSKLVFGDRDFKETLTEVRKTLRIEIRYFIYCIFATIPSVTRLLSYILYCLRTIYLILKEIRQRSIRFIK
jgi:hypothetical protein